jgi:multidrug efflux pump subunit AcrA (membrane-fusion protein)
MNPSQATPFRPVRWAVRATGNTLPVRYLRALSRSARISLALVAGAIVAISGLSAFSGQPLESEVEAEAIPVVARAVELRMLSPQIHVFGRVENPNTTTLRAATLAYVSEVKVREGQKVTAGEVLLRLDDRDARLEVQRREAALTEARSELERVTARQQAEVETAAHQRRLLELTVRKQERFRTLFGNGQISATDYDDLEQQRIEMEMALTQQEMVLATHDAERATARAGVISAQADYLESKLNLERLTLTAPFAGTITAVEAAIGARLDAGQPVVTLFSEDSQRVRVSLAEADARALRDAQRNGEDIVAAALSADRAIALTLLEVGSQVRSGRAGTDVLFAAPTDGDLALGRAVDVTITLPPQERLIEVPLQGVYADRIVYTLSGDALRAVEVERVGVREDEEGRMSLLVRTKELESGDPLVISSLSRAASGTRVRVIGAADGSDIATDGLPAGTEAEATALEALAKRESGAARAGD